MYNISDENNCTPIWTSESNANTNDFCEKNYSHINTPFYLMIDKKVVSIVGKSAARGNDYEVSYHIPKNENITFNINLNDSNIILESLDKKNILTFPSSKIKGSSTSLDSIIDINEI